MTWKRMWFKNCKVYVRADQNGVLDVSKGLVEIKYRLDDDRSYHAKLEAVLPLDATPATAEPSPPPSHKPPKVIGTAKPASKHASKKSLDIEVFTDGASLGNPGRSGIGVVLKAGDRIKEISEYIGETTNNVAELTAIQRALESLKETDRHVILYSDSSYAIGVLTQEWKPKANTDLVFAIRRLITKFKNLEFEKIEGHAGHEWNERADVLARRAASGKF